MSDFASNVKNIMQIIHTFIKKLNNLRKSKPKV